MAVYPQLTFVDRAHRRDRAIELYRAGKSSRAVAKEVGLSDSYVRGIMRESGIARPVGAPRGASC